MIDWYGPLETDNEAAERLDVDYQGVDLRDLNDRNLRSHMQFWVFREGSQDPDNEGWYVDPDGRSRTCDLKGPGETYPVRNRTPKDYSDAAKFEILKDFLHRVGGYGGAMELSYDKVQGEYRYFHKKARHLMRELFPIEPQPRAEHSDDF